MLAGGIQITYSALVFFLLWSSMMLSNLESSLILKQQRTRDLKMVMAMMHVMFSRRKEISARREPASSAEATNSRTQTLNTSIFL
jgi:hypothetical protein